MIDLRNIVGEEWADWYRLSPLERLRRRSGFGPVGEVVGPNAPPRLHRARAR
jgi:hypothetical protein